jgi:hypothetical protein
MISFVSVNWWAVALSALSAMFIGFIWYTPLFGKTWKNLTPGVRNKSEKEMMSRMGPAFGMAILCNILMAYVLAVILRHTGAHTVTAGAVTALWIAVGVVFTTNLYNAIFSWKPMKLFWIDVGYPMLCVVVMGAIIGGM